MKHIDAKEQSKIDKLFEACKAGVINTKMFKDLTGRTIQIGGKSSYSKYSGKDMRVLRAKQARAAIEGQTHYLDGTLINKSRIIDLCV